MPPDRLAIDALLCATLRGERPEWPWGDQPAAIEEFQKCARMHGVQGLLNAAPVHALWPTALAEATRKDAIGSAIWELRHQQVLKEVLGTLGARAVRPVIIKGTAMAYSLYADPSLRTRADTDMVIRDDEREAVFAALGSMGFEREAGVTGEYVSYQANFSRTAADGSRHTLDVHWRLNNSPSLAKLLQAPDIYAAATPLEALAPEALAVDAVHGLFVTVFHRASHIHNPYRVDGQEHYGGKRLIWLHDIHLLAGALDDVQWQGFCRLAIDTGLAPVCLEALHEAQRDLGTVVPTDVLSTLSRAPAHSRVARYIRAGQLRQHWLDFSALEGHGARLRYLAELLFPSPSYMRHKYRDSPSHSLARLYLRRAVQGVSRRLRANH